MTNLNPKTRQSARPLGRGRRGFTLVEAVIVVAVVAVLGAVGMNVMSRGRSSSNRAKCDVQIKSIALALDAFRQEQGRFPDLLADLRTNGYIQDQLILHCPSDPDPKGTYEPFYMIRTPRDQQDLPLLVCPYHEDTGNGAQAYVGRYTTQFLTKPAKLTEARATTITRPGKKPVAAPAGMELRGGDLLTTATNGKAKIVFADGSSVELKKDCTMTVLQSFMDRNMNPVLHTLVRQTTGEINYEVHKGSKFEVVTPAATAGALGTKFRIKIDSPRGTTLLVTEGKVRLNTSKRHYPVKNMVPVQAQKNQ